MKVRFDVSGGGLAEEATRRLLTSVRLQHPPASSLAPSWCCLLQQWPGGCRAAAAGRRRLARRRCGPALHCRLTTICVGHFAGPRLPPMPWLTPSMLRTLPLLPLLWP